MGEVGKFGRDVLINASVERYEVVGPAGGGLDILKARISFASSGQHVEYQLRVSAQGQSWSITKRFSEFVTLQEILRARLASVPELPSKTALRGFSPEFLEARKVGLNAFLQELCKRRDAMNCPEAESFFGLNQRLSLAPGREPRHIAEVQEGAFGIVDFAYSPSQNLLLLGASDCSWSSRLDTKITNIKLPWEPGVPSLPMAQMSLWRQGLDYRFEMLFTARYTSSISSVVLVESTGQCLCGLSNGTVGSQSMRGDTGVINSGSTLPLLTHTAGIAALALDDSSQWLFSASKDNALIVYDIRRQMIVCQVQTHAPTVKMQYCLSQRRLFAGLTTGRVVVFDTSIMPIQQVATIPDGAADKAPPCPVSAMAYDLATCTLFTGGKDGLTLWSVKSSSVGCWGRKVGQIPTTAGEPAVLAWLGGAKQLLAGWPSGSVVIFDIEGGQASYAIQAHSMEVSALLWVEGANKLLTASKDKTLKIWDLNADSTAQLHDVSTLLGTPSVSSAPGMATSGGRISGSAAAGPARASAGPDPLRGSSPPSSRPVASTTRPTHTREEPTYASSSPAPPPLASSAPRINVVGSKAGAAVREDSDDDLAGWDS